MRDCSLAEILDGLLIGTAESFCVDRSEVTPDSNPFFDFGEESLELLDISFKLKKRFGIEADFRRLFQHWKVDSSGQLTPNSIAHLHSRFPAINWNDRIARLNGKKAIELLTLQLLAAIVHSDHVKNLSPD